MLWSQLRFLIDIIPKMLLLNFKCIFDLTTFYEHIECFKYCTFTGGCNNWNNYVWQFLDKCTCHNVLKYYIEFKLIYECIVSTYSRLFIPLGWWCFNSYCSDQMCKNSFWFPRFNPQLSYQDSCCAVEVIWIPCMCNDYY